jgi:sugar phosphate isomerase/epimerase
MKDRTELLAAYYTISGDVYPSGPSEVSPFAFQHRVEAAAKAGYTGIGLVHADLMAVIDKSGFREAKHILEANGIRHIEFEFLTDWYAKGESRRASDKIRKELLIAAQELGARAFKVGRGIDEPGADITLMADEFGKLSEEADRQGTSIVLEIMPFSNVSTIDTALQIVQGASHRSGKLLLDIWHLARGGVDFADIAKVPAEFIGAVELDDADEYPIEPLWEDTIGRRRLPGEGFLDVPAFVHAIQTQGYSGPWGVEILSEVHRKLPLNEMAKRSFDASIQYFHGRSGQ